MPGQLSVRMGSDQCDFFQSDENFSLMKTLGVLKHTNSFASTDLIDSHDLEVFLYLRGF